jgi:four helix bundle protein
MNKQELALRARQFAVDVFRLADEFPQARAAMIVTNQLLRSSSSIAANYRAALRAKSKADFLNKLKIVLEEADESEFWLTFVTETNMLHADNAHLKRLQKEAGELTAIFSASVKTLLQQNLKS